MIKIETPRLILRPWTTADAPALYRHASDPLVGPPAGWAPHASVRESLLVIETVFANPETYAVVLKDTGEPAGCAGLVPEACRAYREEGVPDAEIGYWIGSAHWGRGLIPEAVEALATRAFGCLGFEVLWISCAAENTRSRRVAEKLGFTLHHTQSADSGEVCYYRRGVSRE